MVRIRQIIPTCICSATTYVQFLEDLRRKGQYAGRTDLVFVQLHKGGIGRFMLDPVWHGDADSVKVELAVMWVYEQGPQFVWSATKPIAKGRLLMKETCFTCLYKPIAHLSSSHSFRHSCHSSLGTFPVSTLSSTGKGSSCGLAEDFIHCCTSLEVLISSACSAC